MLALAYPNIDPILIEVGPLAVRWYSLAYIAGLLIGWQLVKRWVAEAPTRYEPQSIDDLMIWALFGVVLGGRLGYVMFYNPGYYLANPGEILHVWQGGMSFHGGTIGSIVATWGYCKKMKRPFLPTMDLVAVVGPIGLGLGRIANFINAELYGRVTDAPWGMVFPGGGPEPRHPSQLYEAVLEGLVLFLVLWTVMRFTRARWRPGILGGLFLSGYALARAIVEFFREPDTQIGFLAGGFTMGQLLCLPMFALGLYVIWYAFKTQPLDDNGNRTSAQ